MEGYQRSYSSLNWPPMLIKQQYLVGLVGLALGLWLGLLSSLGSLFPAESRLLKHYYYFFNYTPGTIDPPGLKTTSYYF